MNATLLGIFAADTTNTIIASSYASVTTGQDYAPDRPFKGIHIGGAGNITITGANGVSVTLAVTPGHYPYGGAAIVGATTTATGIVVLF